MQIVRTINYNFDKIRNNVLPIISCFLHLYIGITIYVDANIFDKCVVFFFYDIFLLTFLNPCLE